MGKFRISLKEWKSWVGVTIVGLGSGLMLAPFQDKATELIQSLIGGDWWIFVIAGAVIVAAGMWFFKTD